MRRESYRLAARRSAFILDGERRLALLVSTRCSPIVVSGGVSIGDFYMAQFWRARARAVHGVFEF